MASLYELLKAAAGIRTRGLTHYERMQAEAIRKARQRRKSAAKADTQSAEADKKVK